MRIGTVTLLLAAILALALVGVGYTVLVADENRSYQVADSTQEPAEERYVNVYEPDELPKWIPEDKFSMSDHNRTAFELTRYPDSVPTREQLDAAWELYNESFDAANESGWFDFDRSVEDGYSMEGATNHWINVVNLSVHTKNNTLNPEAPESLVYYQDPNDDDNKILAGYMYHKPLGSDAEGPQTGGPLTVWHYHDMETANYPQHVKELISLNEDVGEGEDFFRYINPKFEDVEEYAENRERTAEMLHVWFVEHPEGPFGTSMSVPEEHLESPEKMTEEEFKSYTMEKYEENRLR